MASPNTLYLSTDDKKVFGVCGGLAEYFDTSSTLIRLIWVLIVLITGIFPGVIVYLVAAVIIPKRPAKKST